MPVNDNATMFVGIIDGKPSRDFTHPLGMPRGLKGLLHIYVKCNRLSHDCGFIFHVLI
jgi:hypothetical protein